MLTRWLARRWRILAIFAFALLLRLVGLFAPLLDYHSWRQADTAAIARNFVAGGYQWRYPQVDWGGLTPGYVESEFPLYSFGLALLYGLFGVHEWLGRLASALAAAAAPPALYGLIAAGRGAGPAERRVALWAALCLALLPFAIYFGRTVMPDSAMLLTAILALWSFRGWVERPTRSRLALAIVCGALAPLAKTPNLVILAVPLAYITLAGGLLPRRWPALLLYGACFGGPSLVWMRHASRLPLDPRLSFGIGEKLFDAALLTDLQFYVLVGRWSVENVLTVAGLPLFLIGLLAARRPLLPHAWLLGVALFLLVGAAGVVGQDYYVLPLAGPAAWLVGAGIERAERWAASRAGRRAATALATAGLAAIGVLSLARIAPLYQTASFYQTLGQRLDLALPAGERVGVIAPAVSEILYYGQRKGWRLDPGVLVPGGLASLGPDLGVRYVLIGDPWLTERRDVLAEALGAYRRVPVGPYALLLDLAQPGVAQPAELVWETGHLVEEPFLGAWRALGGRESLGLPLSDALDGPAGRLQYFERGLLEAGPDGVARAPVGRLLLEAQGGAPTAEPVDNRFRAAWQRAGGEDGLGQPISPVFERDGRRVQFFEYGLLEASGDSVAPGAAGRLLLEARGLSEERQIELGRGW